MRTVDRMRRALWRYFALTLVGSAVAACHTEQVVTPPGCADPCCDGNPHAIDCGEHPSLTCTTAGDACTALTYGCNGGMYFEMAAATLPASCTTVEAGASPADGGEPEASADASGNTSDDATVGDEAAAEDAANLPGDADHGQQ